MKIALGAGFNAMIVKCVRPNANCIYTMRFQCIRNNRVFEVMFYFRLHPKQNPLKRFLDNGSPNDANDGHQQKYIYVCAKKKQAATSAKIGVEKVNPQRNYVLRRTSSATGCPLRSEPRCEVVQLCVSSGVASVCVKPLKSSRIVVPDKSTPRFAVSLRGLRM